MEEGAEENWRTHGGQSGAVRLTGARNCSDGGIFGRVPFAAFGVNKIWTLSPFGRVAAEAERPEGGHIHILRP